MVLGLQNAAMAADKCADASDQPTLNACAGAAFKASDGKLNGLYRQIQERLKSDPDGSALFVKAQRAWIGFRDAECRFQTAGGGTVAPMVAALCAQGLTEVRIKDFEGYLACEEGDLSCPVPPAP